MRNESDEFSAAKSLVSLAAVESEGRDCPCNSDGSTMRALLCPGLMWTVAAVAGELVGMTNGVNDWELSALGATADWGVLDAEACTSLLISRVSRE